jgi:hypothetical protein
MKSTIFTLLAILAFALSASAQPPSPDTLWTKTYGGHASDAGNSVQQTMDGGYIIAGSTESYGAGSHDVYLIKTDEQGNRQWYRTFGGTVDDKGWSVQQTTDGGFIIVGYTESYGAGSFDVYLIKTDGQGNQQWYRTFGGTGTDRGYSVQQTADGGFIIVGYTNSYGAGSSDVYLIKTDGQGNQQWYQTFGGTSSDHGYSVQQTMDGSFIIVGHTSSYGVGSWDVYLIKTDGQGNQQWYRTFGGNFDDLGKGVQQTTDSGFIIVGYTNSYGAGALDVCLIKTDGQGNQQWYRTFGGVSNDCGSSVQQTTDGGFIIAGYTSSYGAGDYDVHLIKTDGQGNQQWYRTFGGNGSEAGCSVQKTINDGIIIVGNTSSHSAGVGFPNIFLICLESEITLLSLSLSPVNPPITIPATGGSFQFTGIVDNIGIGAAVFDTWFNVSVPGVTNPVNLLNKNNIPLSAGGNLTQTLTQFIPATAPVGTYIYRGFAGEYPTYVVDCDSFTFIKSP